MSQRLVLVTWRFKGQQGEEPPDGAESEDPEVEMGLDNVSSERDTDELASAHSKRSLSMFSEDDEAWAT
jgi:hypothetical protein